MWTNKLNKTPFQLNSVIGELFFVIYSNIHTKIQLHVLYDEHGSNICINIHFNIFVEGNKVKSLKTMTFLKENL